LKTPLQDFVKKPEDQLVSPKMMKVYTAIAVKEVQKSMKKKK